MHGLGIQTDGYKPCGCKGNFPDLLVRGHCLSFPPNGKPTKKLKSESLILIGSPNLTYTPKPLSAKVVGVLEPSRFESLHPSCSLRSEQARIQED